MEEDGERCTIKIIRGNPGGEIGGDGVLKRFSNVLSNEFGDKVITVKEQRYSR